MYDSNSLLLILNSEYSVIAPNVYLFFFQLAGKACFYLGRAGGGFKGETDTYTYRTHPPLCGAMELYVLYSTCTCTYNTLHQCYAVTNTQLI